MQNIRRWCWIVCVFAAGVFSGRADVVTNAVRSFGFGEVNRVAVSPDLRWMATAGTSGAFLWDFRQGVMRHRLEAHGWRVSAVAFSPDSRVLLTGGHDKVVRAWDVESGSELRSFTGHEREIMDVAFAPDGRRFVSASADNTARVWLLETGEQLHHVEVTGYFMHAAVFTMDGTRLVTANSAPTNSVRLWDLASETTLRSFGEPGWNASQLGFLPNTHLATAGNDRTVRIWDVETGDLVRTLTGPTLAIVGLVATTNSSTVIAGCQDGRTIAWNAATGAELHNYPGPWLSSMSGVPGTNQVLTANSDKIVRLRDVTAGTTVRTFEGHTTSTTLGVAFSADGRYVLSGGGEAATRLWNRTNGELVRTFEGHGAGTMVATFSPDGTRILTSIGVPQPAARLWNTETGEIEREYRWASGWPMCAAFSKDESRIATGAQDERVRVWDTETGTNLLTVVHGGWVTAVAFSPDGRQVVSGGSDSVARLWDVESGQLLREFEFYVGSVKAVSFSPAGDKLLVAWEHGYVRLFDPATGYLQREIVPPTGFLNAAVFSPNGEFILTGEGWPFFTAELWDAHTGELLRVFGGHRWTVDSVAFDASGKNILTGSEIVRLWNITDAATRLRRERKGNRLELRWSAGTLQRAAGINGPWEDVTDAESPWTTAMSGGAEFFRIRAPAE
jgi:WD40 repeat protein